MFLTLAMTRHLSLIGFFLVLFETDLAGAPPANAPAPSSKTLHLVTIYRRFIGDEYLGRE